MPQSRQAQRFLHIAVALLALAGSPPHLFAASASGPSAEDPRAADAERLLAEALAAYKANDWRKSIQLREARTRVLEALYGPEDPRVAGNLFITARFYRLLSEYAKALPLYQRALAIDEKAYGPDHLTVAIRLNELATLYRAMGEYARAVPLYERSLAIHEKNLGPDDARVSTPLNNLASIYRLTGEYGQALPLFRRALAIDERKLGPDHPELATTLNNLAGVYEVLGDHERARALMERSLAIYEKASGSEALPVATVAGNLARLHQSRGDHQRALPLYRRSLAIREKALGPVHHDVATSLHNLADLYRVMGETERALALQARVVEIDRKLLGAYHPDVASSLLGMSLLHAQEGDREKALEFAMRAYPLVSNDREPDVAWRVQRQLQTLLAARGEREAAVWFGKQAVNTIQSLRTRTASVDRALQRSLLDDRRGAYQSLADLLIELGRLPEAQQVLSMLKEDELFEFLRSGAEDVRKTQAGYTGAEAKMSRRVDALQNRLAAVGAELEALERKARSGLTEVERVRRAELERERDAGQRAFEAFLGELMKELGKTASAERNREIGGRNLADLVALQETLSGLGHGAVTLHYLVLEDRTHILLTTPQVQLVRQARVSAVELNRTIQRYRELVQRPGRDPLPLARELYRILLAPVADDLEQAKARTLMVSLDGALRYLPLAALHDGERYVAQRYALAIYTEAAKDRLKDKPAPSWRFGGLGLTREVAGFDPLPAVRAELDGIVKGGILPGEVHFDEHFNAEQLRTLLDKRPSVVHVASHFVFKPGAETQSFLLLGDGKRLSLADLRRYRFRNVDLITLSACETAVGGGRDENGKEIEGFGALAQRQGAKGVLATLWPVADASTGRFMQAFYGIRETTPGITKAEALRQAQLRFIKGGAGRAAGAETGRGLKRAGSPKTPEVPAAPAYAHPFYWAPFILMGNWL